MCVCVRGSVCLLARVAHVFHWIRCNHCIAMHGKRVRHDDITTQCPSPRQPVATGTPNGPTNGMTRYFSPFFFFLNCHLGLTSFFREGGGVGDTRLLPLSSFSAHSSSSQQCPLVSRCFLLPVRNLLLAFVLFFCLV